MTQLAGPAVILALAAIVFTSCAGNRAAPDTKGPQRLSSNAQPIAKQQRPQKAARREVAQRARRIIFNNDGNEPVHYMREPTVEALLELRTRALVGSQVDSIFYCTWSAGFGNFTHDTKVGNLFTRKDHTLVTNLTGELIELGIDPLTVMVDFAHENDIELFWSMRMNDTHDAHDLWYGPVLFPPLKQQHPEWLVGSKSNQPYNGFWTTVDYTLPEVRDIAFQFVEEVVSNYDVDGIELDFFRDPALFRSVALGQPASQAELDLFTAWLARVRDMTDAAGEARGRPVLIAIRVPDSLDYAWKLGMDIESWLANDLVDLMTVGGYFRLSPWNVSAELGHRYGVPVYADLSESRQRDEEARKAYSTLHALRGRAMKAWNAGVDGIYMFNAFNPKSPLWHELGDPDALARMDKDYITSARGRGNSRRWWRDSEQYVKLDIVAPDSGRFINAGEPFDVLFVMGENTDDATVTLLVRAARLAADASLSVAIGGRPALTMNGDDKWRSVIVPVGALQRGDNKLRFSLSGQSRAALIEDLQVRVRRPVEALKRQ